MRDAAVAALDAWVGSVPAEKVVPVAVDFLASPKASSEGKVTGLRWICGVVEAEKAGKCVDSALRAAAVASGDKAVEVREAALNLAARISQVRAWSCNGQSPASPSFKGGFHSSVLITASRCCQA